MKSLFDKDVTTLEIVQNIALAYNSLDKNTLSQYTQAMNVDVPISWEDSLLAIDSKQMTALSQCLLTMYSAKYFAAVNLKLNITNVDVINVLNQFSTNKDLVLGAVNSPWLGTESIVPDVCTLTKYSSTPISKRVSYIGMEAPAKPVKRFTMSPAVTNNTSIAGNNTTSVDQSKTSNSTTNNVNNSTSVNSKATELTLKALTDVNSLAVGKTIVIKVPSKTGPVELTSENVRLNTIKKVLSEAKYKGREVPLNKPMAGDVKKSKVFVRDPKTGNVKKVNFGDKSLSIKKHIPARKKSYCARSSGQGNLTKKTSANYWSRKAWNC